MKWLKQFIWSMLGLEPVKVIFAGRGDLRINGTLVHTNQRYSKVVGVTIYPNGELVTTVRKR